MAEKRSRGTGGGAARFSKLFFEENDELEQPAPWKEVSFAKGNGVRMQRGTFASTESGKQPSEAFDFSEIRERVLTAEDPFAAKVVLAGEEAEALTEAIDGFQVADAAIPSAFAVERARRLRRDAAEMDGFIALEDEEPLQVTDRSSYWLKREAEEAQEAQVAEERDCTRRQSHEDPLETESGMQAPLQGVYRMTRELLQRNLPTEAASVYEQEMQANDEFSPWEQQQILKGIDKGWQRKGPEGLRGSSGFADGSRFLREASRLEVFEPPEAASILGLDTALLALDAGSLESESESLLQNIERMQAANEQLHKDLPRLEEAIKRDGEKRADWTRAHQFFLRLSLYLDGKAVEMDAIEKELGGVHRGLALDALEHLFDDAEESDLADPQLIVSRFLALLQKHPQECEQAALCSSLSKALHLHIQRLKALSKTDELERLWTRIPGGFERELQ